MAFFAKVKYMGGIDEVSGCFASSKGYLTLNSTKE